MHIIRLTNLIAGRPRLNQLRLKFPPFASQADIVEKRDRGTLRVLLTLFAVTVATRIHVLGNPIAHIDDQFYLLVGRSILEGNVPYMDIWDRKPVGLFLIYSIFALFGKAGPAVAQLTASASALLTAFAIYRVSTLLTLPRGGLIAAVLYLVFLPVFEGGSGQSPVFYNLPMACAAYYVLLCVQAKGAPSNGHSAKFAVLLAGIAIAIKPVAIFEACYFGLVIAAIELKRSLGTIKTLMFIIMLAIIGAMPAALPYLYYGLTGHFEFIWQATVLSNINKGFHDTLTRDIQLIIALIKIILPFACGIVGSIRIIKADRPAGIFLLGWVIAAVLGFLVIPNLYLHYLLPLLVPLCIAMAPLLSDRRAGTILLCLFVALSLAASRMLHVDGLARAKKFEALSNLIKSKMGAGCLFVYEGPVHLYYSTNSCRLTRLVFPDHLNSNLEMHAVPIRPDKEIENILDKGPTVVVEYYRLDDEENPLARSVLDRRLACNYSLLGVANDYGSLLPLPLRIWARDTEARKCS